MATRRLEGLEVLHEAFIKMRRVIESGTEVHDFGFYLQKTLSSVRAGSYRDEPDEGWQDSSMMEGGLAVPDEDSPSLRVLRSEALFKIFERNMDDADENMMKLAAAGHLFSLGMEEVEDVKRRLMKVLLEEYEDSRS